MEKDDVQAGLTAVVAVRLPEPQFEGQTKEVLGTPAVRAIVAKVVETELTARLTSARREDRGPSAALLEKVVGEMRARVAARVQRDNQRRKNALESSSLPAKLKDCRSGDVERSELFIVEGDSALGTAMSARDSEFQALLPIRGKILNVQKASVSDMLRNAECASIIQVIGGGSGRTFDLDAVRYGRIVIMTDADVDGAHIRTLLLTLFFRYMRPLVDAGRVFAAVPPLHRIDIGSGASKEVVYTYSDAELARVLREAARKNRAVKQPVQRYKGLGEMDADQLAETTMDVSRRTLRRVRVSDAAAAERVFELLMGSDVAPAQGLPRRALRRPGPRAHRCLRPPSAAPPAPGPAPPAAEAVGAPRCVADRLAPVADLPDPVAGLRFRAASREDAAVVHALAEACADVDRQQERESLEDVDEQLRTEWWDPGTDGAVGVGADGEVLAYAAVLRRPGQLRTRQALLRGLVHPGSRGRGVGRALLAWQTARGEELLAAADGGPEVPRMLRAHVEDHVADRVALLRAAGFEPRRFSAVMGRDGALPVPDVPLPDGVELRRLSAATSGADLQERVRQAHNEAFADHWGSEPIEAADWRRYCVDGPGCRPDLSFAAVDPAGRVVGYLVSATYEQDWEPQGYTEGWTDLLGVSPGYRGQGLGRALLARGLRAYLDEGLERAGLGVDVDNPQALGLYLDLGYVERGRETSWVRDVAVPA